MNEQDIYEGIGQVDDEILLRSEQKKHRRRWWISGLAALIVVAVAVGALLPGRQSAVPTAYALAVADYPEMAQYPDESAGNFETQYRAWREDQEKQRRDSAYADGLAPFLTSSMEVFLSGAGEENRVYSPLNVYMALAMLAEVTGGESRAQVLNLLGSDSLEALRSQASDLWNDHYCDDGATTSILASSLWLDEGISYNQDTIDTLADTYYASAFQGQMGDGAYTQALRDWLNEQTGGLLEAQTGGIELTPATILALAATIRYQAKWSAEFREENTTPETFYAPTGAVTVDFMHKSTWDTYYRGAQFGAIRRYFENGAGSMWLILPDEGATPEELLAEGEAAAFLLSAGNWEAAELRDINLALPKFDVVSQLELSQGLRALGVTDVFDGTKSNFEPLLSQQPDDPIILSQVQHDVRVTVDEEGVAAVAYTVMTMDGTTEAMDEPEELDFILDRPFLFAITDDLGLPLFVGIVNQP